MKLILISLTCFLAMLISGGVNAAGMESHELQWRFIKNFVRYVEWPPKSPHSPFNFCIAGAAGFSSLPEQIKLKKQKSPLITTRFESKLPNREELASCDVLYFSQSLDYDKHIYLLSAISKLPILSVSERNNFYKQGGVVQFLTVDRKLKFIIAAESARRVGIVFAPALLRLSHLQGE